MRELKYIQGGLLRTAVPVHTSKSLQLWLFPFTSMEYEWTGTLGRHWNVLVHTVSSGLGQMLYTFTEQSKESYSSLRQFISICLFFC